MQAAIMVTRVGLQGTSLSEWIIRVENFEFRTRQHTLLFDILRPDETVRTGLFPVRCSQALIQVFQCLATGPVRPFYMVSRVGILVTYDGTIPDILVMTYELPVNHQRTTSRYRLKNQ